MKDQTISIQLGPFSNFVGTHLWNLREVNDNDGADKSSLYRSSSISGQKIYPRVLAVDYRENIHPLSAPIHQDIVDPTKASSFWNSPVDIHYQQPLPITTAVHEYENT